MDIKELLSDFIQYVDFMNIGALRDNIRKAKEHSSEVDDVPYIDTNVMCICCF